VVGSLNFAVLAEFGRATGRLAPPGHRGARPGEPVHGQVAEAAVQVALALVVLTLDEAGRRIKEMISVVKPELYDALGLPPEPPQRS
jgi:hypothetical protein